MLALAACNAVYTDVKTTPQASVAGLGGEGIVFLSMVVKDEGLFNYNGFNLSYRNTATKKVGSLRLYTGVVGQAQVLAFDGGNGKGDLKSVTLPAGSYEFFNYFVTTGVAEWRAPQDFSIPFTVTAGKATYLGEVRMLQRFARNLIGINAHAGGRFEIRDMSTRDVPLFKAEFKEVDPAAIVISPMRSGTVPADLVTFN